MIITHNALMKVKPDRGVSRFRDEQRHGSVCRALSGCRVAGVFRFRAYNTARSLERGANCIIGAGNYEQSDAASELVGSGGGGGR